MSRRWSMLETMQRLQIEHNELVVPDWRSGRLEFYRAVWVECAELLDHFGWKWWKHQSTDLGQVKLEIVDIWHFGLSMLILDEQITPQLADALALAGTVADAGSAPGEPTDFRLSVESLASLALAERRFSIPAFRSLLATLPMSYQELFELYVAKNMLNRFRQRHGYREGRYQKLWQGREDNEHLLEIMAGLDPNRVDYIEVLDERLEAQYARGRTG